ncbi:MAG: hypothetical protein IKS31_01760 [Clostridia bacterium]|nr:hypothetical protein [Clostridia bacterium]
MSETVNTARMNGDLNNPPPMKARKPIALIIVLLIIALFIAAGAVSTSMHSGARLTGSIVCDSVRLSVSQPLHGGILVKVENHSAADMNIGWAGQGTVLLETDGGTFTARTRRTVPDHSAASVFLVYPDAAGVPQRLIFQNIGLGLGADNSAEIALSVSGIGERSLRPMNVFETAWAYIRWAYCWMISASDLQGIILRVFIAAAAGSVLVVLCSLLMPRKYIRAKVTRRYIKVVTRTDNGMTYTTYYYMVVFILEDGRKKTVDVRTKARFEEMDMVGWGLLTMKGTIFVDFEYLPAVNTVPVQDDGVQGSEHLSGIPALELDKWEDSRPRHEEERDIGMHSIRKFAVITLAIVAVLVGVFTLVILNSQSAGRPVRSAVTARVTAAPRQSASLSAAGVSETPAVQTAAPAGRHQISTGNQRIGSARTAATEEEAFSCEHGEVKVQGVRFTFTRTGETTAELKIYNTSDTGLRLGQWVSTACPVRLKAGKEEYIASIGMMQEGWNCPGLLLNTGVEYTFRLSFGGASGSWDSVTLQLSHMARTAKVTIPLSR